MKCSLSPGTKGMVTMVTYLSLFSECCRDFEHLWKRVQQALRSLLCGTSLAWHGDDCTTYWEGSVHYVIPAYFNTFHSLHNLYTTMSFLHNPVYYCAVSLYIQILLSWFCTRNFNSDTFMPNTRYVLLFMSSLTILSPSLSSLPPLSLSLCLHPSSLSPQSTTGLTPITTTVNSSTWFSVCSNHLPSTHSSLSSLCTSLRSALPPPFHLPLLAQSSTKFPHDADTDEPIDLELPNKWLWDIVDEFIYQVSFL